MAWLPAEQVASQCAIAAGAQSITRREGSVTHMPRASCYSRIERLVTGFLSLLTGSEIQSAPVCMPQHVPNCIYVARSPGVVFAGFALEWKEDRMTKTAIRQMDSLSRDELRT